MREAAPVLAAAALLGLAASTVLLDEPRARPVATWEPKGDVAPPDPILGPIQTSSPKAVKPPRRARRAEVAPVVSAPAHERVRAMRELERSNPAAAATTAARLVHDPEELVRLNALAVLARSDSPEAARVLSTLGPGVQQLALAVKERR